MYSSIAGLKAHMQKLTVIGNNVANVNTQGYKKQRTIFRDSIYSMYSGGSDGTDTVGSMNPSQLGYGSLVASIDLDMSSSSYAPGNASDCALVGDGFFLVGNKEIAKTINPWEPESFKSLTLSRLGDFHFGADGYLVDGQGNVVYGFLNTNSGKMPGDETGKLPDISDQLVPIRLPHIEKVTVKTTVTEGNETKDIEVEKYVVRYAETVPETDRGTRNADGTYPYTGANGPDKQAVRDFDTITTGAGADGTGGEEKKLSFANVESITIDSGSGAITGIVKESGEVITIGYLAIGTVTNPNGVSHVDSSYYRAGAGAGDMSIGMLGGVNQQLGLKNINSYMPDPRAGTGDTTAPGGTARELPTLSLISSGGNTKLMVGFLESSNVDLATEISELITTQRGYQANTRIITVTDSMLEELVNMKR